MNTLIHAIIEVQINQFIEYNTKTETLLVLETIVITEVEDQTKNLRQELL